MASKADGGYASARFSARDADEGLGSARARNGATGTPRRREVGLGITLLTPALLLVIVIYLYPAVATLVYSVADMSGSSLGVEGFAGIGNFKSVVSQPRFIPTLLRTLYFGFFLVIVTTGIAFLIAQILNKAFRGRGLLRTLVLLPWAVPPVVGGILWRQMFHAEFGTINRLASLLGLPSDTIWLGTPALALHAILIAEVWRWIPFAALFLLAGLQTIPRDVREAAAIDGASSWQYFRHIQYPIMQPVFVPVCIFLFVWAMKSFAPIFVLTRGGPGDSTTTLNYRVYQLAFERFDFGSAAATAYLLSGLTVATIGLMSLLRRKASYA